MTLERALEIDMVVVVVSATVLVTRPSVRFSHPGVIYLLLHAYMVSLRGWAVAGGADTFIGIEREAFAKAIVLSDVLLLSGVVGWCVAARHVPRATKGAGRDAITVDSGVVSMAAIIGIPLGVYSLVTTGFVPVSGLGETSATITTSYQVVAILWPAILLVALIHVRGLKFALMLPLAIYLTALALQGHSRFRFVIPIIMLLLVYMEKKGLKWPPLRIWIPGIILAALFVPMKNIGLEAREGTLTLDSLITTVLQSSDEVSSGTSAEQGLLDQGAIAIQLADQQHAVLYGRPYVALLTLPFPRRFWEGKPGLADHLQNLQTPRYPIAEVGAITTLAGDLYLNFRLWGVGAGGFLLALWSGRLYERALRAPSGSIAYFAYVLVGSTIVQVARDGVISIVMFTLVNATPWVAIWYLSLRKSKIQEKSLPTKGAPSS